MKKLLLFSITIIFLYGITNAQQTSGIKGRVVEKITKTAVPFANVVLEKSDSKMVIGGVTDIDGYYFINLLNPGEYDLKVTCIGCKPFLIQKIVVDSGKVFELNVELESSVQTIATFEVREYKVPVIKKDMVISGDSYVTKSRSRSGSSSKVQSTSAGTSKTQAGISRMSGRESSSVACTVGGVTSIRGSRFDGTITYIDGVKVSSSEIPKSAMEQVTVIAGGLPASYGEADALQGQKGQPLDKKTPPIICPVKEEHTINTSVEKTKTTSISSSGGLNSGSFQYSDYNTESYLPIKENEFKMPRLDPLSTFSIDVDRASYGNVRRFLFNSQKVPYDAVRYEELINYFDYDYPQPTDGHPFSITIEGGRCPWNPQNHLVLIGLKGENVNELKVPANNLVFLLDVSGSMNSPEKLPLVKQSLKILIEKLRPEDHVAIVVYAGAAGCVLESTPGDKQSVILRALNDLQAGGSTAGGAGIELAYKIAKENFIENGNNRVILATDGDFNVGASSDDEMVELIKSKRDQGIFLTILGFGMGNYKDSKMELISNAGNGNYAYIDNILEAKKMFGVELWGTLYTIAKDVKIQVEFNPAKVKKYRLIGYEDRLLEAEDFNDDTKDAGEIGCGHTVTALYEIVPMDPMQENEEVLVDPLKYQKNEIIETSEYLTVKFRYKKPNEDRSILIEKALEVENMMVSNNIVFAAAVAEFAMLLRNSEFKGNSNYDDILAMARKCKGNDPYEYKADFIKLVEMAELIYKP